MNRHRANPQTILNCLAPDTRDIRLCHSFVSLDDAVAQLQILRFEGTYLGQFRYRHDMRKEEVGTDSTGEALGKWHRTLSPWRTIQGNEDTPILNGAFLWGAGRHK
jgi:hypothetical protein